VTVEGALLALAFCLVGAGVVLSALRALAGPTDFDRVLALDAVFLQCVALILLLSIAWHTSVFFDLALVMALLGFIVTMAVARYLGGRHDSLAR
jgi:multicomponent K+:H+ antiporter subunit F